MTSSLRTWLLLHQSKIWLIIALTLALFLRLWGGAFGLPNLYHPDEDAVLMPAISIIKTGELEPTRMDYGTFYIYVLTAVSAFVFILSARNGNINDTSQLAVYERGTYPAIYNHPEYFLAARTLSALLSTGIVLLTYMLVRRLGNERQGVIAGGIAAVLPALVVHGHFATTDIPLTFFCLFALYLLLRAYDNWEIDTPWRYAGAGFVCGLAASTKYNGAVLIIPLLLVPILKAQRLDDWLSGRVLVGPICMILGFFVGTPYAVLNIPKFLFWIGYALRLYGYAPPGNQAAGTSWQWHLNYHISSPDAMVFFLGVVGFLLSFRYWGKRGMLVNSFAVFLWLAIISQVRREARMWLPTTPIFLGWSALVIDVGINWLHEQAPFYQVRKATVYLPLLICLPLLVNSVRIDRRFQAVDVRTQTQQWIEDHIPPGSKIAVEYFSPNLDPGRWPVIRELRLYDRPIEWYQEQGVRYLVTSEAGNDPTKLSAKELAARTTLLEHTCPVQSFSGPFLSAEAIQMWIYQVPPCD